MSSAATTPSPPGEGTKAEEAVEEGERTEGAGAEVNQKESGTEQEAQLGSLEGELKRAAERNPGDFFAQTAYARFMDDIMGNSRVAVYYFNKALKLVDLEKQPEMRDAYVHAIGGLAEALESMKLYEKANQSYDAALRVKLDDALCLGNFAVYLHRIKKDVDAAGTTYRKAAKLHKDHASVLSKYATFLKNVHGNNEEAEHYYRLAVEAAPHNADCLGSYAVFLHGQKRDDDTTAAYYRRALEADPCHVNILSNYGLFLAEVRKDLWGAKAVYERALSLDPQHANCLYNYAVLYDSSFRIASQAEHWYREALRHNPRHAYALYNLAILVEERAAEEGQLHQVRLLFEKAVAAAPGDAMTLADFGRFVLVRERDAKLAEEVLQRALAADPDYGPALFYMGMLLLNFKDNQTEAEKLLRRCLANNPTHSGANQYLARILAQDKRRKYSAADYYNKALESSPTNVELLLEFSRYLADSRRSPDKERAKELHRKACDLSQSSVTRVARPSRRSPAQKSTPGATPPDSSSKSLTPSASVVESLVRPEARAGWPRRTRERAESASTAMWSSKGAAADEAPVMQGQEALQPWEARFCQHVYHRRARTLPSLNSTNGSSSSQGGGSADRQQQQQEGEEESGAAMGSEESEEDGGSASKRGLPWLIRRHRGRSSSLDVPPLVVRPPTLSVPVTVATAALASMPAARPPPPEPSSTPDLLSSLLQQRRADAFASNSSSSKTDSRQPSKPHKPPVMATQTTTSNSSSAVDPTAAALLANGGLMVSGKSSSSQLLAGAGMGRGWEKLPSRGDGVTGWDEPGSPPLGGPPLLLPRERWTPQAPKQQQQQQRETLSIHVPTTF